MPIPIPQQMDLELFPTLTKSQIDAARTSAWYDTFEDITFPSTVIDLAELGEESNFLHWLEADSIFLPEGSQGRPRSRSSSNASSSSSTSSSSEAAPTYYLPRTNAAIRDALEKYGGSVFPKLNWTAPKDAAFILPQTASGPLHCTSPADVYLLLKSSDFISHDLEYKRAYLGCQRELDSEDVEAKRVEVELVLKKFEDISPSREIRCFVRNNILIGITQRDTVFYDHLQSEETRDLITRTVREFWEDEIRENYAGGDDYIFDLYLSPNLDSARIMDFQPYRSSVDPLLFSYEDLLSILQSSNSIDTESARLPILRYIDSKAHPGANTNAPTYQSNMMPIEMIELSQGRNMQEFKEAWDEALAQGMTE
uniref:Cytoplasmic protein n=1 Tax=Kwoniella dejecticola CBS 10117 TaxID=1296121 RepID=A0A1A6A269_9TREE|nr:cytoplasmic protein [Kwoniella dejecticola CBS 10117]OBR84157.1 cytoplasmic protein [Kwoniella dejecticola CBS 10117]